MSVLLVGAALSMTEHPAAAEIPTRAGTWYIVNVSAEDNQLRCVDDSVIGLRAIDCNYQSYQRWDMNVFSDGSFEFVNNQTGNCLDDSPTYHLRAFPCNGGWGGYQKWHSPRDYELMNVATGLCLDYSNQFQLRTFGCNGGWGGYQDWGRGEVVTTGANRTLQLRRLASVG